MKILITGSKGQLGNELKDIINKGYSEIGKVSKVIKNSQVFDLDVDKLDITDLNSVKNVLDTIKPDVVI
ncbi:sugar nucleotide-binding protein, partial [Klebsiella pneumoniae]|nr:sugar nucleotide-binding protein [Klebsiella pneumoniae]